LLNGLKVEQRSAIARLSNAFLDYYTGFHTSAMEEKLNSAVFNGRPFGGTCILIRNQLSK